MEGKRVEAKQTDEERKGEVSGGRTVASTDVARSDSAKPPLVPVAPKRNANKIIDRINDTVAQGKTCVSFEFFPAKV